VAGRMECEEDIELRVVPNVPFGFRFDAPKLWGFRPDFTVPFA